MIPVLEGKVPVWVNANGLSEIQGAVTWAGEEGVKLVIVGGRDAWRVAAQLKAKHIPVILSNILDSPNRRWEDYDLIYSLPKKLNDEGVTFCISGDGDPSNARNLNHHAAAAVAFGLPQDKALKAITLDAARILGIDSMVGSIEPGKDATLLVADGDILQLSTSVEREFIQGKKIDLRDKQKQLYEKYEEKYKQQRGTN